MLSPVSLVEQWRRLQTGLPADWVEVRLLLLARDPDTAVRAAAALAPLAPGRSGRELRFTAVRAGNGPSAEAVRRALGRLDADQVGGQLELLSTLAAEAQGAPAGPGAGTAVAAGTAAGPGAAAAATRSAPTLLVPRWHGLLAQLPEDWSDLHCQLDLVSSDHLEPAALLTAPLNPVRFGPLPGFRFRVARRFGYGASPQMVVRCFERLDAAGIGGSVEILRALSDTRPVGTQGPVWYVGGKVV
jgi:hypothetical protein